MFYKQKVKLNGLNANTIALIFILVYVVLMAPYVLQFIFFLPDERHYIDAAIYMLQHGGYFSPHDPNTGGYRFLKPIFTYWAVFVSYKIFGISQFSSRFPFLVAGALVLWMTYKNTLLALKNSRVALLALCMAAAVPLFNRSVATTLTDILLYLFLLIMFYGVTGILVQPERRKYFLACLYFATGFAVEVKGLIAIAFFMVCLLFLLLNPWKRQRFSDLLNSPAIILSVIIGLFWYVVVYFKHGAEALSFFYQDQVGYRFTSKLLMILINFLRALVAVFIYLFPFFLVGWQSLTFKENRSCFLKNKEHVPVLAFAVVWILAITAMSTMVSKFYPRYLIPASFPLSFIFAFFIMQNEKRKAVGKMFNVLVILSFVIFTLLAIASVFTNCLFANKSGGIILTVVLWCLGVVIFFQIRNKPVVTKGALTSFYTVAIFTLLAFLIHPLCFPNSGEQINNYLERKGINAEQSIQYFGGPSIASQIRVASKGKYYFKAFTANDACVADYIIFEEGVLDPVQLEKNYNISLIAYNYADYPIDKMLKVCGSKEKLKELLFENSRKFYIATKKL